MPKNIKIQNKLEIEYLKRTANGSLFLVILSLCFFIFFGFQENFLYLNVCSFFLIIIQTNRFFSFKKNSADPIKLLKTLKLQIWTTHATALFWGLITAITILRFGLYSFEGYLIFIICVCLLCFVPYALAPLSNQALLYILLLSGMSAIAIIYSSITNQNSEYLFAILIFFLIIYITVITNKNGKELYLLYFIQEELVLEKENLDLVVNTIPGFVALVDKNNDYVKTSTSYEKFKFINEINEIKNYFSNSELFSYIKEIEWKDLNPLTSNEEIQSYILSFQRLNSNSKEFVLSGLPINELKKLKHELEEQRLKAEYSSRLATLGEMAAGIAHEINNPLAIIVGNITIFKKLIESDKIDKNIIFSRLNQIEATTFRISKIISGLRSFSRQAEGDPFLSVELKNLMENTLSLCSERFKSGNVKLELQEIPNIFINAREAQISQVLLNILNNSYDALDKQENRVIKIEFEADTENLKILISDNGPGIPDNIAFKIFEPFYTTKEIGKGTGLGLSISKGIMQDHKGDLTLKQNKNPTTFEVKIPIFKIN